MTQIAHKGLTFKKTHAFIDGIFGEDLHAKRVYSLANAALGCVHSASLAVCTLGHGLAAARGRLDKHAIKQVDRLLSNAGVALETIGPLWVTYRVGARPEIVVAMDWTDFDADNQSTIMLAMVSQQGHATPLVWLTVDKSTIKNHRNAYEDQVLTQLSAALPAGTKVLILADRGFGDPKRYRFLKERGFDYLIRFKGNITVTSAEGEVRPGARWVGKAGRAKTLKNAHVTADGCPVTTVVCVQAQDMKEAWCLASSLDLSAEKLIKTYGRGDGP